MAEIQTERRYSQVGGVQNNAKLYLLQNRVREADEALGMMAVVARKRHWEILPCAHPKVVMVAACIEARDAGNECNEEQQPYSELLDTDSE